MITRQQALEAKYWLIAAHNSALLAYYDNTSYFHLREVEREFRLAAAALGYDLVERAPAVEQSAPAPFEPTPELRAATEAGYVPVADYVRRYPTTEIPLGPILSDVDLQRPQGFVFYEPSPITSEPGYDARISEPEDEFGFSMGR